MRTFEDHEAKREMTPLWVGIAGPSASGKTFSALRIAKGIQEVSGGDIYGIDTEGRRMLHYAEDFKFRHVPFGPPFRSLDYLQAVSQCAAKGGRIVVVDSMSHEHEGSGGYLAYHAKQEELMAGNAAAKFAAWQKPSQERNDLIQGMLQLPISFVFCFRAKEKLKPGKEKGENGREKSVLRELGWMPIGGQAFIYEMTACCLLPPGCMGVPSWNVAEFSEEQKLWVKKPKQFENLFKKGMQLSEAIGKQLALWSNGGNPPPAGWHEQQAASVSATASAVAGQQAGTGEDVSYPCPVCKNNPPACSKCEIPQLFRPAEIHPKYGSRPGRWYCPRKCTPTQTTRNASDWHAVLHHDQAQREPGDDSEQLQTSEGG